MNGHTATKHVSKSMSDPNLSLHKQYGGVHTGKWVDCLPVSWIPFIQIARLSPPTPVFLIYFPHIYGIVYGAILNQSTASEVTAMVFYLLGGSIFFSNAAHGWDDLIDVPIDKLIVRTQKRPIVRGALTSKAAFIFTAINAIFAALFLIRLPLLTSLYVWPTIIGTTYYPFAKRHISCPQLVLGFCLAWGITVGASSMGVDPWGDKALFSLVTAYCMCSMIFDTIYASIDVKDDIRLGLGSTAVLFGKYIKSCLMVLLAVLLGSLTATGIMSGFSLSYYLTAVAGCAVSLSHVIISVEMANSYSCWWWFTYGFWGASISILCGLLSQYIF